MMCILIILCFNNFADVQSVVPSSIPLSGHILSRDDLIKVYFKEGLKYSEIIMFLFCKHNIKLCVRQLKRILRRLRLRRRHQQYTPRQEVVSMIKEECNVSGVCVGYRTMWKRLVRDHGLAVKRNDVMKIMKELYPYATEERKAHRLQRRTYRLNGPNYVWHVDGYDKLKPFGFCIHGCIDGYSRRVMWLEVASTNNNPSVVAKYYLDCLKSVGCAPRILRADHGTENSSLRFLQPYFRHNSTDSLAGMNSFMRGRSTSNQRIEAFWGTLRKLGVHWWINFFKDIRDSGLFDIDHPVVKECLQYCFMDALQTDLDRIAKQWNLHDIRQQKRYAELPSGKPDVMYFVPELTDGHNFRTVVDTEDVNACIELYGKNKQTCTEDFKQIVNIIKPNVQIPIHPDEALRLFIELNVILEDYLT